MDVECEMILISRCGELYVLLYSRSHHFWVDIISLDDITSES